MKESYYERKARKKADGLYYKFVSPGRRGVPDRLHLRFIPEALRPLIAKYIRFVEHKRPGEAPEPHQEREHARIRALGFKVDIE